MRIGSPMWAMTEAEVRERFRAAFFEQIAQHADERDLLTLQLFERTGAPDWWPADEKWRRLFWPSFQGATFSGSGSAG
jgi:hypothetical protein